MRCGCCRFSRLPGDAGVVFVVVPDLIGTLVSFFLAAHSDPSVAHRTKNYPYVEQLVPQIFEVL